MTRRHGARSGGPVAGVVLGDQLDHDSPLLKHLTPGRDTIVMLEVREESAHVPSHRQRTVLFLSAMRHYAEWLRSRGFDVWYSTLDDAQNTGTFTGEVERACRALQPTRVVLVEPGEHRVRATVATWPARLGVPVDVLEDTHFLTTHEEFEAWAKGRRGLTMEYFYRQQRRRLNVLMEGDAPTGGTWNYDRENRESFGKAGPDPWPPLPVRFEPDEITREVIATVRRVLPQLPGRDEPFGWPVTRKHALAALDDFVTHRLPLFGPYEDAMWTSVPFVYHSTLSPLLNLKLLNPRECIKAALKALESRRAPLQSVEAFVRQLIGWREYIRGVYWHEGPSYESRNGLKQYGRLPHFYWTGETDMACMRECLGQVVDTGFGHHIQRLMVTGNFALIAGVHPREVSDWYLAMYVDAVDWVTLPNALGMVMHADGTDTKPPVVGTKPYAASGQYISRMSNYCRGCRYEPSKREGEGACPFTVFYWDFLNRHRAMLERNPRMTTILKNLDRFGASQVTKITVSARSLRTRLGIGDIETPREPTREHDVSGYAPPARSTTSVLFADDVMRKDGGRSPRGRRR